MKDDRHRPMSMIYDSEHFVVVHFPFGKAERGFEIVDKRKDAEVFLHGTAADAFEFCMAAWKHVTPTNEEVERTLDCFTQLGTVPLLQH